MGTYDPRYLITPPKEEEEVYPYRRVWPSLGLELGVLFAVTIALFVITRFVTIPPALRYPALIVTAVLPVGLWYAFSVRRERSVPEPRRHLLMVAVVSALAANAIGIPLVRDVLQIDRWLPLDNAINRIVGYTFTVGIVQEFIKYVVVRYAVWSQDFRTRLDGIAFCVASAVGYSVTLNLDFVLSTRASLDVAAITVFGQVVRQVAGSMIVAYGLSEIRFNRRPFPFLMPATVALAALVTGIAIPLSSGLSNASVSVSNPIATISPLRSLLFSGALIAGLTVVITFLFNTAERQDQEAATRGEE